MSPAGACDVPCGRAGGGAHGTLRVAAHDARFLRGPGGAGDHCSARQLVVEAYSSPLVSVVTASLVVELRLRGAPSEAQQAASDCSKWHSQKPVEELMVLLLQLQLSSKWQRALERDSRTGNACPASGGHCG